MKIRRARLRDVKEILELFVKCDKELTNIKVNKEYLKVMKSVIKNYVKKKIAFFQVVEDENEKLIGYIFGFPEEKISFSKSPTVRLEEVYIIPKERGKRISNKLLKNFYSWAKKRNAKKISINVNVKNNKSLLYWGKEGFKKTLIRMVKKLK